MEKDVIGTLNQMLKEYRRERDYAATKEYKMYYAGAVEAVGRAIKILKT